MDGTLIGLIGAVAIVSGSMIMLAGQSATLRQNHLRRRIRHLPSAHELRRVR